MGLGGVKSKLYLWLEAAFIALPYDIGCHCCPKRFSIGPFRQ